MAPSSSSRQPPMEGRVRVNLPTRSTRPAARTTRIEEYDSLDEADNEAPPGRPRRAKGSRPAAARSPSAAADVDHHPEEENHPSGPFSYLPPGAPPPGAPPLIPGITPINGVNPALGYNPLCLHPYQVGSAVPRVGFGQSSPFYQNLPFHQSFYHPGITQPYGVGMVPPGAPIGPINAPMGQGIIPGMAQGMIPGMIPGVAPGMAPGMVPGMFPQYPGYGQAPGIYQAGIPPPMMTNPALPPGAPLGPMPPMMAGGAGGAGGFPPQGPGGLNVHAEPVLGVGRTPQEIMLEQIQYAYNNGLFQPQDFKPADDDPSRMYFLRQPDGAWCLVSRATIDNIGDCRWYLTDQGYFYAVRLPN